MSSFFCLSNRYSVPQAVILVALLLSGVIASAVEVGSPAELLTALENTAGDNVIELQNDINGDWSAWPLADGYALFSTPDLVSGDTVTIDLKTFAINGSDLDIVSDVAKYQFGTGTLGSGTENFRFGGSGDSTVDLNSVVLNIAGLQIGSTTTTGAVKMTWGSITADSLKAIGFGSALETNSAVTVSGGVSLTEGASAVLNGATQIGGDLIVNGVTYRESATTPGVYEYSQSQLSGNGTLTFANQNLTVKGGAAVDLSGFGNDTGYTVISGKALTVDGVFIHGLGPKSFQTTLTISGPLNNNGGTINVTNGAALNGVTALAVAGGTVEVSGALLSDDDGQKYHSAIRGKNGVGGALTINNTGIVNVKAGGLIDDRTTVTIGSGSNGTLNIDGMDASTNDVSTVNSTGALLVGDGALGKLNITGGGFMKAGTTTIGRGASDGTKVTISGAGSGSVHSKLAITGDFTLSDTGNAEMLIEKGGLVTVSGTSYLGNTSGKKATITLKTRGGTDAGDASLNTAGRVIVGNGGDVDLTINTGGSVSSGLETILGGKSDSNVKVTITSDHYRSAWKAGGTAAIPTLADLPLGNAQLEVDGGVVSVTGLFAMAGQNAAYDHTVDAPDDGKAIFRNGGELHLSGGVFFNMNETAFSTNTLGLIEINDGGIVSGSGSIYAGERFAVNGGTIAPGSRGMYDFQPKNGGPDTGNTNKLDSLGTLHIYDNPNDGNPNNITRFYGATFRTELDRPIQGTIKDSTLTDRSYNSSDHAVVHGDLDFDNTFNIDISRPLDGKYLLINTDGVITNFVAQSLDGPGGNTVGLKLNLNGKLLEGNNRIDYAGGMSTMQVKGESGEYSQIWLDVDTTSDGNVKTYWTGNGMSLWDMTTTNFRARNVTNTADATFTGKDQFLDGDIVYFDYSKVAAGNRTAIVTTDATNYMGDLVTGMSAVANVRVAEINVIGGTTAETHFSWGAAGNPGGSIYALDSALYSTLDRVTNGETPSGRFNKIGEGVLDIYNANEFYGGIHLGDAGVTGGRIILHNEKGLGTYDSTSGFQEKGLVTVHEDSIIELATSGMTINNRFIVETGRKLTFVFNGEFTVAGNNALASDADTHDGKGGGVFIGNDGRIVYEGTGTLHVKDNKAKSGGGIYTELGYTLQVPANVTGNYASGPGGGIFAEKYFQLKDGSDISGNAAQSPGGGIYVGNMNTFDAGDSRDFVIHGNSQIMDNKSGGTTGGGVYVNAGRNLVIKTAKLAAAGNDPAFGGGDVWFKGNLAKVGFDADDPTNYGKLDLEAAVRNALHLSDKAIVGGGPGATLEVLGPYNTYFYDPISGDLGTNVTIQGLAGNGKSGSNVNMEVGDGLDPIGGTSQYGTTIFHGDSAFYGSTTVAGGATFRLEDNADYIDAVENPTGAATYGRKATKQGGAANSFSVDSLSRITGRGTIVADSISLNGTLDLDTGTTFLQPGNRNGSGDIAAAAKTTQGILALEGTVAVGTASVWTLNLTNVGNVNPKSDLVEVTGNVSFDSSASDDGKMEFIVDNIVRGKYAVMTATGTIANFNTIPNKTGAPIMYGNIDLSESQPADANTTLGRLKASSYVDAKTKKTLYLDVDGRNRHVTSANTGNWGHNPDWTFNGSDITNSFTTGTWSEADTGPTTNTYIDGDMVTFSGGTHTLTTNVNPVDLFVTGNVTIDGNDLGITTFSTTGLSTPTVKGTDASTITTTTADNDYGIAGYTGKLYKNGLGAELTFDNGSATVGNTFTGGIVFAVNGVDADAGTIVFERVNQIGVGTGGTIDFLNNGILKHTGIGVTETMTTPINIADGKTATFDIVNVGTSLTASGILKDDVAGAHGAIQKSGAGTLVLSNANTFSGGATLAAGTIQVNNNTALSAYNDAVNRDKGLVTVTGTGTVSATAARTIQNRFLVDTAGAGLTLNNTVGLLTIQNVNAGNAIDGGAVYVRDDATQLAMTGAGSLTFNNNQAKSGGAIFTANSADLAFSKTTTLSNNKALAGDGGAVHAQAATVTFNGTGTKSIASNTATGKGGAIYAQGITVNNSATIATNTANQGGGFYVDGGTLTLNPTLAANAIVFTGNTASAVDGGQGAYLAAAAGMNVTGLGNVIFRDTIATDTATLHTFNKSDAGMVVFGKKAAENNSSVFHGTTNVNAGTFRILAGNQYGSATAVAATDNAFNLLHGANLIGAGTIQLGTSVLQGTFDHKGVVAPDAGTTELAPTGSSIGTLTVNGNYNVTGTANPLDFQFDFDLDGVNGRTVNQQGDADLLIVDGTFTAMGTEKIIFNLHHYTEGKYLLIKADTLSIGGFGDINGIGQAGAFDVLIHDFVKTDRHRVEFLRGDQTISGGQTASTTANAHNELWLATRYNNLYTYWTGACKGTIVDPGANDIWQSVDNEKSGNWHDINPKVGGVNSGETHFENKDSVVFADTIPVKGAVTGPKAIKLGSNVTVSAMRVDTTGTYSFEDDAVGNSYGIKTDATAPYYEGSVLDPLYATGNGGDPDRLWQLTKQGTGTLTFTNKGGNNFAGGIWLEGGTTTFTLANQLGTMNDTTDHGINFNGSAATLQAAANNLQLGNQINVLSGKAGTIDAQGHALTLNGNGTVNLANGTLGFAGTGFVFIDKAVTGSGTVDKANATGTVQIGANSGFAGTTNVSAGTFRVIQDKSYGSTGSGTFSQTGTASTVAGGGTIRAAQINLAGIVSPDNDTLSTTKAAVGTGTERFGTLTLDGKVALANSFQFTYNAGSPIASTTVTQFGYGTPTGDLVKMQNGGVNGYTINDGATINFVDTLTTGKYLIFAADQDFTLLGGNKLDGIRAGGVVKATGKTGTQSPRGGFQFVWGTGAANTDVMSQIWLDVNRNSLTMTWLDAPANTTWVAAAGGANFNSTQYRMDGATEVREQMFNNGDYVVFDTKTSARTIGIDSAGVIVSGMKVDASSNYTFNGNGGITSLKQHATIEGEYLDYADNDPEKLTPDGKLTKQGIGTLTMANTGTNIFSDGIDIYNGKIDLAVAGVLGVYSATTGNAGLVSFLHEDDGLGNDTVKTVVASVAQTIRNRFYSAVDVENAAIIADAALTIDDVHGKEDFGAIGLRGALTLNARNADIVLSNNSYTAANGTTVVANDIALIDGALTFTGSHHTFINSGIAGAGSVTKNGSGIVQIGADSSFDGDTTHSTGTFRVVQGKSYGIAAGTGTFAAADASTVSGGGTIKAAQINLAGIVAPDKQIFSSGNTDVGNADKLGTLTLDGKVDLAETFQFTYNAGTPIARNTVTTTYTGTTGDLIKMQNGGIAGYTINDGATVNFVDTLVTGKYLIFTADEVFVLLDGNGDRTTALDGIRASGVVKATGNTGTQSPRGGFRFVWGTSENTPDRIDDVMSQIWLDVNHNTLTMTWNDSPDDTFWLSSNGGANFTSTQSRNGNYEQMFNDGDYVVFDTKTTNRSITIGNAADTDGVIVSGMKVDATNDYTFSGNGIKAYATHATIEGDYINETATPVNPDGKLQKFGAGTLKFVNAANTFYGGIEISDGTIAFTNAGQLGDGGNGISFLDDSTLRSDASIASLGNELKIAADKTATLDSNGNTFVVAGRIDDISGTGNVLKDGAGTVRLTNASNAWSGVTTVETGTLQAVGVETLGDNLATKNIDVKQNAELQLEIAANETLSKKIAGAGVVTKTAGGTLTLDNDNDYIGGTTIAGGKIVAETLDAVGKNVETGIVTTQSGTALELKLETAEGGIFAQQITGDGKLVKSGDTASTLTLSRTDNDYTGGTDINSGRIQITDVGAVGNNVTDGIVNLNGATTSLELALATNGTSFNQKIAETGELVKTGGTTVALTNANTFTGGTQLTAGKLELANTRALNQTDGILDSKAGFVYVTGNSTVTGTDGVDAIQNRFDVSNGIELNIGSESATMTIQNNNVRGVDGGAIKLGLGASFTSTNPLRIVGNETNQNGGGIVAPTETISIGGIGKNTISLLEGNTAGGDGGGIYAKILNINAQPGGTTISGNTATGDGGAAYLVGGTAAGNAVSTFTANAGSISFENNTASGVSNAIHLNQYNTLNLVGSQAIHFHDGISSDPTGTYKNSVVVDMSPQGKNPENAIHFYDRSMFYGNTTVENGYIALHAGSHFGAMSSDNVFTLKDEATLYGVGTIEANSILLGATVNAGKFTDPRQVDIQTLGFVGATTIGNLSATGIGQTMLKIDIFGPSSADLMNITGTLDISGNSKVDFSTFSVGKYLIARTDTDNGVTGYHVERVIDDALWITDFESTVGGLSLNPARYQIIYSVEDNVAQGLKKSDVYVSMQLNNTYNVWTGANRYDEYASNGWPFNDNVNPTDPQYLNDWLNDPLFNWRMKVEGAWRQSRFRQGDLVAFDSVADVEWAPNTYLETRKNIELITHTTDNKHPGEIGSEPNIAEVGDMIVTGGGTYRFTGRGISATIDSEFTNYEGALGQLAIDGYSTAIFANEANNFQRGIFLQNGAVAFNNPNQLETIFYNDSYNGGVTAAHGIIIDHENSYGKLIANADDMVLGIVINIDKASSMVVIDTDGNNFGDSSILGNYTLTLKHAEVDGHTGPTKPIRKPVNGIHGEGKLVKVGNGTLILADENTYMGGTWIEKGTVAVGADNRLGDASGLVKLDSGTLRATDSFASNRIAYLTDKGGTLEVDDSKKLTWNGTVTGTGDLSKSGKGTLFLTNTANDYAGNTVVNQGTLYVETVHALGANVASRSITLNTDGSGTPGRLETNIASGTDEVLVQKLKGTGDFVKTGGGTLCLETDSTSFAGSITVLTGTLEVMADYCNVKYFTVESGATLCGTGILGCGDGRSAIGGRICSNGTVKPCGVTEFDSQNPLANPSAKPLTINGDLNFTTASLYNVVITQFADPTYDPANPDRMCPVSDCIVVNSGKVSIDSTAKLAVGIDYWGDNLSPFDFGETTSDKFTIINAEAGSVDDREAKFTLLDVELPRGVELEQGWNGSLYQLWFIGDPSGLFEEIGETHNQKEVGKTLDSLTESKDPGMKELVRILSQKELTDDMVREILSQLAGDLRANSIAMALKMPWRHPFYRIDRDMFPKPLDPCRPVSCRPECKYKHEFWAEGYGQYGDVRYDGNSYSHSIRRAGTAVGVDKRIAYYSLLGAAFNYSQPQLRQATGSVKMDDYEIGLYNLTKLTGTVDLKSYLGYSHQEYDLRRHVYIPAGSRFDAVYDSYRNKTDGNMFSMSFELQRPMDFNDSVVFTPLLALDYEHVWQKGYAESGGRTALRYDDSQLERLMFRIGVNTKIFVSNKFDLFGRLQYATQLNKTGYPRSNNHFVNATAPGTPTMDVWGSNVGRDYVNLGIGGEYYLNRMRATSIYFGYDADLWKGMSTHSGYLGFTHRW